MLSFKELDIFYKLCENSHISNLAKTLGLTQSAISISLNSLEKKIGEKLFDRIGKKLILNERGRKFKEISYKHFLALANAREIFSKDKLSGNLKIASSKTFNNINLASYIYKFIEPHDITVSKHGRNTSEILEGILNSKYDIGFIEMDVVNENIIRHKIGSDCLIVVTADKELADKQYYIDQLYSKNWILREEGSGTRQVFFNKIKNKENMNLTMEITSFMEIKSVLANNKNAITCIPKLAAKEELENGELFELKIKNLTFKRNLYLIHHKDKFQSKLFTEFIDYVKKLFKEKIILD